MKLTATSSKTKILVLSSHTYSGRRKKKSNRLSSFAGIWHVNANWVLDTAAFNEWMNQEDYEIDYDLYEENGKIKFKKPTSERKVLEDVGFWHPFGFIRIYALKT